MSGSKKSRWLPNHFEISIHQNSKYRYLPTTQTSHSIGTSTASTTFSADEAATRGTFFESLFVHSEIISMLDLSLNWWLVGGGCLLKWGGYGVTSNEMDGYMLRTDTWMDCNLHWSNRIEGLWLGLIVWSWLDIRMWGDVMIFRMIVNASWDLDYG